MAARPRIGVLTFHSCVNYGSYWQARCLVEGLRASGQDAELLDHHCRCIAQAELRCALQPRLPERASRREIGAYARKVRSFAKAISQLPLSDRFSLHEPESMPAYETIVIGSDEVWNLAHPWYGGKPLFYGAGLNAQRVVSYAGSFGSYSCHWGIDEYWAGLLKRFDALSVRDQNSFWLVQGSTGRAPHLALDPCLQFPPPAAPAAADDEQPYALVYGHGFPKWLAAAVRRWAKAAGVRLLSIGYHNGFADEQMLSIGPLEFATMMARARAVITNFFHGCVFALLNGRPFVTAPSEYRLNKVRDLTQALGAQRRIVGPATSRSELDRLLATPPLPQVVSRIGELRESSGEYLRAALA